MVKPRNQQGEQSPIDESGEGGFPLPGTGVTQANTWASGTPYAFPARLVDASLENINWIRSKQINPNDPFPIGQNDSLSFGPSGFSRFGPGPRTKQEITYYGSGLVDERGKIAREGYADDGSEVRLELITASPEDRALLLRTAKSMGLYGSGKPSDAAERGFGMSGADINAIQGLLDFAVGQGRTWKHVALLFQQGVYGPVVASSGTGRSYSVVSREDATAAFKEASLRLLGRMPTPQEIQLAVKQIQQNERARAMGGSQDPASLSEAAMAQARGVNQPEMAAQAAGNAATRIMQLLGGR